MTRQRAMKGVFGVALAGVIVASAAAQSGEHKPRPLLVGVVDLGTVFMRYERSAEIAHEIARERTTLDARANDQKVRIEELRKEADGAPKGTAAWREKTGELKLAQKALEAMQAESEAIVNQRFEALTLQVIDEIDASVHAYAKANNFDLLLKTTTKGWGETRLPERVYRAQVSTLVAYDPSLDVTEAVIRSLNDPENVKGKGFH